MKGLIFLSYVEHCRARVHRFSYKTVSVIFDLNNIAELTNNFIAYNRHAIFSIWDKDYLPGALGNIKDKFTYYLAKNNKQTTWDKIELVTSPKFLGYVFNPVSFYLCYRHGFSSPALCVAEVNNTFGETHLYIAEPVENNNSKYAKFVAQKDFHVSPFYDRQGEYEFFVRRSEESIEVKVNLLRAGETVFTSSISAKNIAPSSRTRTFYWGLLYSWLTFPKIVAQAVILKFQKGLTVYTKPVPNKKWTIGKRAPNLREIINKNLLFKYLKKLKVDKILFKLPDGTEVQFGDPISGEQSSIEIHDWSFFTRVIMGGDVAFGECYTDGIFDSDDITKVISFFAKNIEFFDDREIKYSKFKRMLNIVRHRLRFNSKAGARKNIHAHYDLGNNLFEKFLDTRMIYSAAVYQNNEESLEQAQLNKLRKIISKAQINAGEHILEIGSGWGAFAIEAVKSTGCRVTTITLSEEQREYALRKIASEGLSDRIDVLLCDYRDIKGSFDKIVSIEMLEAVGHENLPTFFEACNLLLKPGGRLVLQVITFPNHRYEQYRKGCDWIQKYIFPGGICPSLAAIENASKSFKIIATENIALSYALTLSEWKKRFKSEKSALEALGYDEHFQRTWEYYLSYCEAGFSTSTLGTLQMVLAKQPSIS